MLTVGSIAVSISPERRASILSYEHDCLDGYVVVAYGLGLGICVYIYPAVVALSWYLPWKWLSRHRCVLLPRHLILERSNQSIISS